MKHANLFLCLVSLLTFTLQSCYKQFPATSQQLLAVSSDSLIVGPGPHSTCYPIRGYLTSQQGGSLPSVFFSKQLNYNSDGKGFWSWLDFIGQKSPRLFHANTFLLYGYHVSSMGPPDSDSCYFLTDPGYWHAVAAFNASGQITSLVYNNDVIAAWYQMYYDKVYVEFPDLKFQYASDGKLLFVNRHWPDGSFPDDVQKFSYDSNGNIISMTTLRNGVTDASQSLLTLRFTYGAPTTSRQFYTWFQGGSNYNSLSLALVEYYGWVKSFTPKNLLLRVDRYERIGSGPSHYS
ncbi:MAG TPA: hypothetical protein VK666_12195, partial [Chryseolinea sp.]|nr:hypothetical protein [Chryseolinea sp.]